MRGLHYQISPNPQGKLVRCISGEIFDVAVDIRSGSKTFGEWGAAILSSDNHQQLWIPEGFAHGFLVLSNVAEVLYKTTDYWSQSCERSLAWNDSEISIVWPGLLNDKEPKLSVKDLAAPLLENQSCLF